jgi:hypothetical protein
MNRDYEFELRLAEAAHTEEQLRKLLDILIGEGEAVFASRSWRLGKRLTDIAATLLHPFGFKPAPAQDAAHWHRIVAAHDDALRRRRLLLDQLVADPDATVDIAALLATLWREAGDERVQQPEP